MNGTVSTRSCPIPGDGEVDDVPAEPYDDQTLSLGMTEYFEVVMETYQWQIEAT